MIDHFFFLSDATVNCELQPETCLLCIRFGDKIPVERYAVTVAGNAANVAVSLRRLALPSALATVVGDDVGGREIAHRLEKEGVETRWLTRANHVATNVSGVINFHGERTILVHHTPRHYPKLPRKKFDWIYFTSLGPKQNDVLAVQRDVAAVVDTTGARLAYNPGSYQLRLPKEKLRSLLPKTDVLFVNKEEAQLITNPNQAPETPKQLLVALAKLGVRTAVMTDGPHGSYAYDHHTMWFCAPFPGKAISRTGAGDSFGAGVVAALAHGETLPEALRWGSANAANVVQHIGPQAGLLHKKEMERVLKQTKRVQAKKL